MKQLNQYVVYTISQYIIDIGKIELDEHTKKNMKYILLEESYTPLYIKKCVKTGKDNDISHLSHPYAIKLLKKRYIEYTSAGKTYQPHKHTTDCDWGCDISYDYNAEGDCHPYSIEFFHLCRSNNIWSVKIYLKYMLPVYGKDIISCIYSKEKLEFNKLRQQLIRRKLVKDEDKCHNYNKYLLKFEKDCYSLI